MDSRSSSLLVLGEVTAAVGATVAAGYWIYTLQSSTDDGFWTLPGFLSLGAVGLGVGIIAFCILRAPRAQPAQRQRAGDESTNVQAGRDVTIEIKDRARRDDG